MTRRVSKKHVVLPGFVWLDDENYLVDCVDYNDVGDALEVAD